MEAFFLLRVFQNLLTENVEKAHTLFGILKPIGLWPTISLQIALLV